MSSKAKPTPAKSAGKALAASKGAIAAIAVFSLVINVLMLTGPMFMLQVYDRVLSSHSVPTLISLCIIALILYAFFGLFDMIRSWLSARVGSALDRRLAASSFDASAVLPLKAGDRAERMEPVRDLEQIRTFISGPGLTALFDLPWMPLYLGIVYLLHPMLGLLGTIGAVVLFSSTLLHEVLIKRPTAALSAEKRDDSAMIEAARRNAEVLSAMGMLATMRNRWLAKHHAALDANQKLGARSATFTSFTKTVRFLLQSGVLALGAWLAIKGELSPGAMIAASIILTRALAPVEQVIGQWRAFVAARLSMKQLSRILPRLESCAPDTELPAPSQSIRVEKLVVAAPGSNTPVLKGIDFALNAGDGVGIIGPSGAGKTSMVRALLGIWKAGRGEIRFDGALIEQYSTRTMGSAVGYLPQDVELFDGTVAENIARFTPDATSEDIIAAAKAAGCHDMILTLADGYDTRIGPAGQALSGGQRQRIGLARAVFGTPFLVILDEPNSNLDGDGELALNKAIGALREAGSIVVIIAHRHSALAAVNKVLALKDGMQAAFGPRDEVMEQLFAKPDGAKRGPLKVVKR